MKFIVEYFEWIDVSISNSHLLCMDTTNENSGDKKDLKYLLQHRVPLLVWIGCGNHKLALCFKHLMGEYTNINDARCYLISFMEVFLLSSSGAKLLKRLLTLIKSRSLCQVCPMVTRWTANGRAWALSFYLLHWMKDGSQKQWAYLLP